jgi:2-haloacid dehalogenase
VLERTQLWKIEETSIIMPEAIGFDVYGTLVDPLQMNQHLRLLVGDKAESFAQMWREKQIEYAFRRGLMRKYETFAVCTKQSLLLTMQTFKVELSTQDLEKLMEAYQNLPPFPDVIPGLESLRSQGDRLVAFSNGTEAAVRTLLGNAAILQHLDGVVSVDDLKTFKPDPEVYAYLSRRLDRAMHETWLVSSNPWDVIGGKSAGLRTAWIERQADKVFDPWGISPDIVVASLEELSERLGEYKAN